MTIEVQLPPALAKFAEDSVAAGRYETVSEVVASGLRALQAQEERKAAFAAMLADVEAEVDRGEVFTLDEIMADIDSMIEATDAKAAAETVAG